MGGRSPDLSPLRLLSEALGLSFRTFPVWFSLLFLLTVLHRSLESKVWWVHGLILWCAIVLIMGALHHALWVEREGRSPGLWETLVEGLQRAPGGLNTMLFFGLGVSLLVVGPYQMVGIRVAAMASGLVAVFLHTRFLFGPAVCFIEDLAPLETLERAARLAKGRLGILLLAYLCSALVGAILGSLLALASVPLVQRLPVGGQEFGRSLVLILHCGYSIILPLSTLFVAYCRIRETEELRECS